MDESRKMEINGQTFIIDIKSIQNNTWQGTIFWTQTQRRVPFRSALELIRLMDSAIGTNRSEESEWEKL